MEGAPQPLGDGARGPGAEKRVEHQIAHIGRGEDHAMEKRLGLLGGVRLAPPSLDALGAGAKRQKPVRTHLKAVVERLHGAVVEPIGLAARVGAPDQGFVGVGEPPAAEVGHGVRLAPNDVVEDPKAFVLHHGADAVDVVVGPDHPQRAVALQQPSRLDEPGARELVVAAKTVEAVPRGIHARHLRVVGPQERAFELQVVGRVGEDHVDRGGWQRRHDLDAVAEKDLIRHDFFLLPPMTRKMGERGRRVKKQVESRTYEFTSHAIS